MNKLVLAVLLLLVTYCTSLAQLSGGAKAGINFNSFRGDESYDVVPGLNVGGFVKYKLTNFMSGRGELLFHQQGANLYDYRVLPELYRTGSKVKFNTISVPLLLEFGLSSLVDDDLQPKLLIGGFFSYVISARERYNNIARIPGYDAITYGGKSDVSSLFEKTQYGLIGGLAADVTMFKKPMSIEFRYYYNLNEISKPGATSFYNLKPTEEKWGSNLKLATLSLTVAMKLFQY